MDEQILQETKQDQTNKQNFINVHFQSKFVKHKQTYSVNKVISLNGSKSEIKWKVYHSQITLLDIITTFWSSTGALSSG